MGYFQIKIWFDCIIKNETDVGDFKMFLKKT